jgi:phage/plasmid-like protein (TIGR03299 family)
MSAGILENDTMFSVKERPWHGLGTVVENAPTIKEAIKLAGLDWTVSIRPLKTNDEDQLSVISHNAVVKDTTKDVLGVVGNSYKPLQNSEAFDFFEPFIDNDMATLETAGSLFNGKKVFILAKINCGLADVAQDDFIENFVLLSNSHDGSQAIRVGFTPIRVVCNNTLSSAISSNASKLIRVKHMGNVVANMEELRETMDLVNKQFLATIEQYRELTKKDINQVDLRKYVKQCFSWKPIEQMIKDYDESIEIEETRSKLIKRVEEIFELEPAHKVWNAYNAVNSYLNHERGKTLESRYNSTWFGVNKKCDMNALKLALHCY